MKRNWYAIAILVLLAAVLLGCKQYVSATAGSLRAQVQSAYCADTDAAVPAGAAGFPAGRAQCKAGQQKAGAAGAPPTRLDRMNETMAVLSQYANPENQADLAVEAARVLAQIDQLEQCFTGTF